MKEHKYGIDILRSLTMLAVVIQHIISHGGIIKNLSVMSLEYEIIYAIYVMAFCAVNTFGLISGYVGYGKDHKVKNMVLLHTQVLFYTVLITLVYNAQISPGEGYSRCIKDIIKSLFPVVFGQYWYFTAYFALFFLMPFLDKILDSFSQSTMKKLILLLLMLFSVLPTLASTDIFHFTNGYSFIWLAILYLFGAYIKKYGISIKHGLLLFLICSGLSWLSKFLMHIITLKLFGEPYEYTVLVSYLSPTMILAAVGLLSAFSSIKTVYFKKLIKIVGQASFGVYLLHEMPLVRENLIRDHFIFLTQNSIVMMVFEVLGIACAVFMLGITVDIIRKGIFKILHLPILCDRVVGISSHIIGKMRKRYSL